MERYFPKFIEEVSTIQRILNNDDDLSVYRLFVSLQTREQQVLLFLLSTHIHTTQNMVDSFDILTFVPQKK